MRGDRFPWSNGAAAARSEQAEAGQVMQLLGERPDHHQRDKGLRHLRAF
jgi:hypothetical protein